MKKLQGLLILIMCIVVSGGCSKGTNNKDSNAEPTGEQTATNVTTAPNTQDTEKAGTQPGAEKIDIRIAALKGPTAIGMVKIMEDASAGTAANNDIFSIHGTADEISAGLLKGEIDIAAIPCNLASVLYNKTKGGIKLAAINTLGVLYIVETGDSINTAEDLKGKTIYSTGIGTTPQYTLNYLLSANGLNPEKDLTIEYKTEATEVAALLSKSTDAVAMLPQPYVATVMMKNDKVKIALDVAKEWEKASKDGSGVVTGVVVARSEFLKNNKEAFDAFMKEYEASASYVNKNVEESAALVEKYDIFKAAVAKQAIPYCNITFLQGEEMKEKVNGYLNALYQQNPQSVGGKLPEESIYYMP